MQMYRSLAFLGILAVFCLPVSPIQAAQPWQINSLACPKPPQPLSQVVQNVDRETATVSEMQAVAQLDIASAYAPEANSAGASWCIRYELTDDGPDKIPVSWWPLAGFGLDPVPLHLPQSYATTIPPGPPPIVKSTDIYFFRSQTVHTRAYQAARAAPPAMGPVRLVAALSKPDQRTEVASWPYMVKMDGRSSLPAVGGEFTGSKADVGATSTLERDGSGYRFTIYVGRNNKDAVIAIYAPFAVALGKVSSPNELAKSIPEFRSSPLLLDDNSFRVTREFKLEGQSVFVVRQPVTLIRPTGRVCFLAAVYSPVPIPAEALSCN